MKDLTKQITWSNVNASNEQIKEYVKNYARDMNVYTSNLVINNGNVSFTTYSKVSYEQLVNKLVAERYTIQDELAIQRKAYNGLTDEFHIYNAFVEECKVRAKQFISERESALNDIKW